MCIAKIAINKYVYNKLYTYICMYIIILSYFFSFLDSRTLLMHQTTNFVKTTSSIADQNNNRSFQQDFLNYLLLHTNSLPPATKVASSKCLMSTATMDWGVSDVFKIIALYRQYPCLWEYRSLLRLKDPLGLSALLKPLRDQYIYLMPFFFITNKCTKHT